MIRVSEAAIRSSPPQAGDYEFLNVVEPFTVFPERWLSLMTGLMRVETYVKGETIFRAGDSSDSVFVVRAGQAVVFSDTVGEPVRLMARVNPGEMFGEVGVLESSPRSASARAASDTRVLRLEGSDLSRLGRASRRFGARLVQSALLRYMRDSASSIERGKRGDVRIRVDRRVILQPAGTEPIRARIENLSQGGACLRDVPEVWAMDPSSRISLRLEDATELFEVKARIAWSQGTSRGLAFRPSSPDHDTRIDAALDVLLSQPQSRVQERDRMPQVGPIG